MSSSRSILQILALVYFASFGLTEQYIESEITGYGNLSMQSSHACIVYYLPEAQASHQAVTRSTQGRKVASTQQAT